MFKFATVQKLKTSDGSTFDNREEAIRHETKLALRGVIQADCASRDVSYSPIQIANLIMAKQTQIKAILLKSNKALAGTQSRKKVDNSAVVV